MTSWKVGPKMGFVRYYGLAQQNLHVGAGPWAKSPIQHNPQHFPQLEAPKQRPSGPVGTVPPGASGLPP